SLPVFQRVMSADSAKSASRGAIIGGALYILFAFVPMFLVVSALIIMPEQADALIKEDPQKVLPTLVLDGERPWLATGASGGRRIMPAVMQILSFLIDYKLPLEAAFHQPRIDASVTGQPWYDPQHEPAIQDAIRGRYPGALAKRRDPLPLNYACPSAVMFGADGTCSGMVEIAQPWASVAAA
ncbi:MAG: gamma-glutamyltransferase, partial [Ferrovibrio sp.]